MRRRGQDWRSRAVFGLLAVLLALAHPCAAFAHATLTSSSPEDRASLADAPASFRLTFNEAVAVTTLRLVGRAGAVSLEATANGASIDAPAPGTLERGSYALSYRAVSEDGHPIAGTVTFALGEPGADALPAVDPKADQARLAIWAARSLLYIGLLFGVGGAFAIAWLSSNQDHGCEIVRLCLLGGLAAAPAAFALQGADLTGAGLAGVIDPEAWRLALSTSYAWTVAAAIAALGAALLSISASGPPARALSGAALAGVGVALAASGHASAASPQIVMRAVVFVHAVAAAFWIGALIPLLVLLSWGAPQDRMLARFSAAAPFAIGALIAAGAVIAFRQVGSVEALWSTDYGLVLSAKLLLVSCLFYLATLNRWGWTRPAEAGSPEAQRRLRRSVTAEIVIGAIVLGVVALWRFTPPPRALVDQVAQPAVVPLENRRAQAKVTLLPGRAGLSTMTLAVAAGSGGPLDAKQVSVVMANPAGGVEPIRRDARRLESGQWRVDGLLLPLGGAWALRIELLVSDFDVETLEGRIEVRP